MGKIDRNEAPEGYVAKRFRGEEGYDCTHCAFYYQCIDDTLMCDAHSRKDGQSVIFVKKPATK